MEKSNSRNKQIRPTTVSPCDSNGVLSFLKMWLKYELSDLEKDLDLLENLRLRQHRLGQYEESRAYHRAYTKTLRKIKELEKCKN